MDIFYWNFNVFYYFKDLSMTQSEDDLDLSVGRGRRRGKRASLTREDIQAKRSRHASGVSF